MLRNKLFRDGTNDCELRTTVLARSTFFLSHQGIELKESTLYQDNTSAMKMERNGRDSCSQKSRPIDIRYFWIKDRLQNAPNKLEYCPTEQMLADFFTKPLQGNLFKKFRHVVMGWDPTLALQKECR